MAIFQGPLVVDQTGGGSGTLLDAAHINTLVVTQVSYLQAGLVPSSATSANPPVVTQPAITYVINSGTAVTWIPLLTSPITLPTASVAQDVYCDIDDTGTYTLQSGAVNFTPSPPAANALRIWKATTGTSNVGVASFTDLANRSPLGASSFMAQDGSNALAVAFPTTLAVTGATTLSGGVTLTGGILRFTTQPAATVTKGAGLSAASTTSLVNGGSNNGKVQAQIITSGSNPASPVANVSLTVTGGATPLAAEVQCDSNVVAYADAPVFGSAWSFNIYTTTSLPAGSTFNFTYNVIYQ